MKNNIVKALALFLSVNWCFPGMLVNAEEPEEKTETVTNLLPGANLDNISNESEILSEPSKITELPQFDSNDISSLLPVSVLLKSAMHRNFGLLKNSHQYIKNYAKKQDIQGLQLS